MALAESIFGLPRPLPYAVVDGRPQGYLLDYVPQYGVLVLLGTTGVALGLLLSACVSSPDRANALLPYVLIPQIILGGGILSLEMPLLKATAMTLSPAYWAYDAIRSGAQVVPDYIPGAKPPDTPDDLLVPCLALATQTVVLLLATAWCLRRKDVRRA
jgi:hypothetical protein